MQMYRGAASWNDNGLVAGALQDNGVVGALLTSNFYFAWQHASNCGCDGGSVAWARIPRSAPGYDTLVRYEWSPLPYSWAQNPWVGTFGTSVVIPLETSPGSFDYSGVPGYVPAPTAPVAVVRSPTFSNSDGELMLAVIGKGATVYGLFAAPPGFGSMHWEALGSVGASENVIATASRFGFDVFAGTDQGNIYRVDSPYSGPGIQLAVNPPPNVKGNATIDAILEVGFPPIALAAWNVGSAGFVLKWQGKTWDPVGGLPSNLPFFTLEAPNAGALFAATRKRVYVTYNLGTNWLSVSQGLPEVPWGNDLNFSIGWYEIFVLSCVRAITLAG